MYIWIFLATIMVALSFFNLSPRSDTDNAVNEVKASITVNRFRAEHLAFVHSMECELIMHTDNGSWKNYALTSPHDITIENMNNLPYTDYASNLPIGYEQTTNLLDVYHVVVCTKKKLEEEDGNSFENCTSTSYRYAISYAQIPDRWLSKDIDQNEGIVKPLPTLVNLMAKATGAGSLYGWTDCSGQAGFNLQCILRGYSTRVGTTEKVDDKIVQKYTKIPSNSLIWNMPHFGEKCGTTIPCLFAYERFLTSDKGHHCKTLMGDSYPYSSH
ncbi:MAG: hypothetical protein J6N49_06285 [Alphaproteobacteria bacterium]|nr:hypothetical protein [Alphaproteobacteria bacterium]